MKFVLVHGFNVRDGGLHTVDQLAPLITDAGYDVNLDEGDYGFFNIWMVRFRKSKTRQRVLYRLAKAFETADVIITHSNGANFTTQALEMLTPDHNNSKLIIHISPALDRDTPIPLAVHHQLVLYTPHDKAVRFSSWLLFHPWGRMGAKGYSGNDNRNTNRKDTAVKGHSSWFKVDHVLNTWSLCKRFIESHSK
jgi:hypothetical protein